MKSAALNTLMIHLSEASVFPILNIFERIIVQPASLHSLEAICTRHEKLDGFE